MFHLDAKLSAAQESSEFAEAEWREIMEHVIGKLEAFLGQPVATSNMNLRSNGFDGDIESPTPFAGRLHLSWFGRIGTDGFHHDGSRVLVAFIFLRGAGKRLVAISGQAYLYLQYKELEAGVFGWIEPEWDKDVFGEFEDWE